MGSIAWQSIIATPEMRQLTLLTWRIRKGCGVAFPYTHPQ